MKSFKSTIEFLQKKVISNNINNNSFFSEIFDDTDDLYDVSQIFSKENNGSLSEFLHKQIIEFKTRNESGFYNGFNEKNLNILKRIREKNVLATKDIGETMLYLGFPFIKGFLPIVSNNKNVLANNAFYAPLFFWEVEIEFSENGDPILSLGINKGKPKVKLNSRILEKSNIVIGGNEKISKNLDLDFTGNNISADIESIAHELKLHGLVFEEAELKKITQILKKISPEEFANVNKFNFVDENKARKNTVENIAVLGFFPPNNSNIYNDYLRILENNDYDEFFQYIDSFKYDAIQQAANESVPFQESQIITLSMLDYPQKKAVKYALEDNIVIQGPPGTGKSETISNIIANLAYRLHSVLFVAEKRTAGEVVYNRLKSIKYYTLMLFDDDDFNLFFTNQLKIGLDRVSFWLQRQTELNNKKYEEKVRLDQVFTKVDTFRKLMSTDTGKKYPIFLSLTSQNGKELEKDLFTLQDIIYKYDDQKEFWAALRNIASEYDDFLAFKKYIAQDSINMTESEVVKLFELAPFFADNDNFYTEELATWVLESTKSNNNVFNSGAALNKQTVTKTAKYQKCYNFFKMMEPQTKGVFSTHNGDWFLDLLSKYKTEQYRNLIKFAQEKNWSNFDFFLAKNFVKMNAFAVNNLELIKTDGENYYDEINSILNEKKEFDGDSCEISLISNILKKFKEHPDLYDEFNDLYTSINGIKKVNDVKATLTKYKKILSLIFIVILAPPNAVSDYIACKRGLFDNVIFDEASQITLEKSLPILYRAKKLCIVGDEKQLPPESYFNRTPVDMEELISKDVNIDMYNSFSLLSYISKHLNYTTLTYHYRSRKNEIISFNNYAFYDKKLNIIDIPEIQNPGIITADISDSEYENGVNAREADIAIKLVNTIITKHPEETVGIIVFSKEMRNHVLKTIYNHPNKAIANELRRIKPNGEFQGLFVKTVNDIQGDERDNIIIVCEYSVYKSDKSFADTYAIFNNELGDNYLNVITSRAKNNIFIVKSFMSAEIQTDSLGTHRSLKNYINYLTYAEEFSKNPSLSKNQTVKSIFLGYERSSTNFDYSRNDYSENINYKKRFVNGVSLLNYLTESVVKFLETKIDLDKFDIVCNRYEGRMNLDIVIINKENDSVPIAIICDIYENSKTLNFKETVFYIKKFFETKKWQFTTVTAIQWFDPGQSTKTKKELLEALALRKIALKE